MCVKNCKITTEKEKVKKERNRSNQADDRPVKSRAQVLRQTCLECTEECEACDRPGESSRLLAYNTYRATSNVMP